MGASAPINPKGKYQRFFAYILSPTTTSPVLIIPVPICITLMDSVTRDPAAAKRAAGYKAAEMVKDGMIIGLGTGSTVMYTMEHLSQRMKEGLVISGIPTSFQTAIRAREYGIPLTTLDDHPVIDLAIDGADEVDPQLRLIKGRGAAHTREKCVAAAAKKFIVVVDEQKIVTRLDGLVPVEIVPFAIRPVMDQLRAMGCDPVLREGVKKDGPVITDNMNFILDAKFKMIAEPDKLETAIGLIPGVVESGLFCNFTGKTTVIVGGEKKCRIIP
jgi:ribose 5-phosphate isomerase A